MSATGNEIVKLNQLKMYVKYASDEDVWAYLTPPSSSEEIPVTILKENLISSDVNVTMNSDGLVNISLTLSASSDSVRLYVADELFSIPSKYAPSAIVKGTLGSEEISMNTNGVVTYTGFTSITIRSGLKFPVKISYEINVESDSNATGNEVVRLSQVKKYLLNGSSGSGGSSSDGTVLFEGYEQNEFVFENNDDYTRLVIEGMDQGYQTRTIDINPIDEGYHGNSNQLQISIWLNANQVWITLTAGVCITKVIGYK